ncbi:hypothetical protein HanRHA438_Chr10g0464761 [Helianthus annuus]|nr:hypothetical protein HanHA300_Chr10g0371561 [Helianthus annuus]KAJ0522862.1 hypothetical protein HanIR_Chr10g0487261 [Helianthus annuus]KAJ0697628.1 hypothetical protein HanLR1_Chr10g0371051 [Helianthus annuus]KAJ0880582.1 hypothetical protein HanRHA438_Chr10g0464761 [Helianthus annuus]
MRKPDPVVGTSEAIYEVRYIRSRFRSVSNKKSQPPSQTMSEALPFATKGSLSKHLKVPRPTSSLVSGPLLVTPIAIPTSSALLKIKQKGLEVTVAPTEAAIHASSTQASSQSKFQLPTLFRVRIPLAPFFAEGCPPPYVPNWKITSSSIINIREIVRSFMSYALPPSQRFMNVALDPEIFEDQHCMATLKEDNKDLEDRLKTSQTTAIELQCRVVSVERDLLEKEHARALLKERERAWNEERAKLMREMEQLVEYVNHYKVVTSVSGSDVETLYTKLGIVQDDNQKLAAERHWLLSEGFGRFLAAFTQSPDFKGSLERTYQAHRNVRYQTGLKDGYAFSSQCMRMKETPTTTIIPRSSYPSCRTSSPVKPLLFLLNCLGPLGLY